MSNRIPFRPASSKFLSVCLFVATFLSTARAGIVFDLSDDFSATVNPNGLWSFGWSTPETGFHPYPVCPVVRGLRFWESPEFGDTTGHNVKAPNVVCNTSSKIQTCDGIKFRPGDVTFHPGPYGEIGVIRWSAPASGRIQLSTAFQAADFGGTTVYVRHNEEILFQESPDEIPTQFDLSLDVQAGDVIDLQVDANGDYGGDTVRVEARIVTGMQFFKPMLKGTYNGALFNSKRPGSQPLAHFVLQIDKDSKVTSRLLIGRQIYRGTGYVADDGAVIVNFGYPSYPSVRFEVSKPLNKAKLSGTVHGEAGTLWLEAQRGK